MFSGIVEGTGRVVDVRERDTTRRFAIQAPFAAELEPGDSVAVDGACLTVTTMDEGVFSVDVIGTTLERTIAGTYRSGARVNLERSLRLGARLDGHLVQGHVDGVGHLERIIKDGEYWILDFVVPTDVAAATILHGSIALNGVSLTVSEMQRPDVVRVGIIPYTWEHTNLGELGTGDPVNVEGDLIGKYVARILATRGSAETDG